MNSTKNQQQRTPLTFKQTSEKHPAFPEASLRWLRFNGSTNGFDMCVIKVGRRILIDQNKFDEWLENQREA